ncbi:MAG: Rrf2 family transcriptional regulator [Calditrichia bacterium]
MKLSKTAEHAIRATIYIALQENRYVSVNELKEKLDIPYKYVGRIMPVLARAGIVHVQRGKLGGYKIEKDLSHIKLEDIVEALETLEDFTRCLLGFPNCSDENPCPVHEFWGPIRQKLSDEFLKLSLKDITDRKIYKI